MEQTTSCRNRTMVSVALISLCTMFADGAKAQCGSAAHQRSAASLPAAVWPDELMLFGTESTQQQPFGANAEDGGEASLVGLWRIKFTSGETLIDQGLGTFHGDGTELLVDTPFGSACPGVWQRIGPRIHKLNHPLFNFDPSGTNVVSIGVYRGQITLDPSGNSFTGAFTWDSYDFSERFIPGSHVQGTLSGRRVTIDAVPFYLSDVRNHAVAAFDTRTNTLIGEIPVPTSGSPEVVVAPELQQLAISDSRGTVFVYDLLVPGASPDVYPIPQRPERKR
jgi:hypothetical protein